MQIVLEDQLLDDQGIETFTLPANTFQHSDPSAAITVEATLSDGSALPSYILFDAESGEFQVDVEEALNLGIDKVVVRVTGRDSDGNEATATFTITIKNDDNGDELPVEEQDEQIEEQPEGAVQDQTDLNLDEAGETSTLRLDQQLNTLGSGEFAVQKAQLLMDIQQLFG